MGSYTSLVFPEPATFELVASESSGRKVTDVFHAARVLMTRSIVPSRQNAGCRVTTGRTELVHLLKDRHDDFYIRLWKSNGTL